MSNRRMAENVLTERRATAQNATLGAAYGSDKSQVTMPRYVYIIFDDCPEQFGEKRILGVRAEKKVADDDALREKGKDAVGGQYIEVQRWRLK